MNIEQFVDSAPATLARSEALNPLQITFAFTSPFNFHLSRFARLPCVLISTALSSLQTENHTGFLNQLRATLRRQWQSTLTLLRFLLISFRFLRSQTRNSLSRRSGE
jgi:hypothetical protein